MTQPHDSAKHEENENTSLHDDAQQDSEASNIAGSPEPCSRRLMFWAIAAGGVALLLAGGLAWSFKCQQTTSVELARLQDELTQLKQDHLTPSALDFALVPLREQLQQLDTANAALQKRISEQRSVDGRYIEIDYQLRMALQRLTLNGDVAGALTLMKSADQRIAALNDPAFIPVRDGLSKAMVRLDDVAKIDTDGLYLQLSAESQAVDGLVMAKDLATLTPEHDNAAKATDEQQQPSWWRRQLSQVAGELKQLVVVRYNDQSVTELLMPEQESAIREHLRLSLGKAQLGLLRQSPEIYRQALDEAMDTLRRYFPQDERLQVVLTRLDSLKAQAIRPALPDVSDVLQQWLQAVERRHTEQGS